MALFVFVLLIVVAITIFCFVKLAQIVFGSLYTLLFGAHTGQCLFWFLIGALIFSGAGIPFALMLLIVYALQRRH